MNKNGAFKKLFFDKKDRNKVGSNYYIEILNINKFKFYITDKKVSKFWGQKINLFMLIYVL